MRESKAASEPKAIATFMMATGLTFERVGIEAGPLAPWLCDGLAAAGLPVICIDARHPLERNIREIRRRTRVVGAFPDGQSALNLAAARLRDIAGIRWSTRRYLYMHPLNQEALHTASPNQPPPPKVRKILDITGSKTGPQAAHRPAWVPWRINYSCGSAWNVDGVDGPAPGITLPPAALGPRN